jgi:hypothetical protein
MTTLSVERERAPDLLAVIVRVGLRQPEIGGVTDDPVRELTWTPDLTPAEQDALRAAVAAARLTVAERTALEPVVAEIRTFRTRTPAEWNALTAAQRDSALIQWCQDLTDVLRAILRDG